MDGTRAPSRRFASPLIERAYATSTSVVASGSAQASAPNRTPRPARPLLPPPTALAGNADIRALVHRATWGFSVSSYQEALSMGYDAWLEWQLDWENIPDPEVDSRLLSHGSLDLTNPELLIRFPDPLAGLTLQLREARLERALYTRRQLYERMVEFWTDHFNINQLDELCQWFKTSDDREVIRRHALGKFPDMLRASAHSPAMIWYLDNYTNVAGAANENYARELQELHTLGVEGPYDEFDVAEVARCFTGWTVHGATTSNGRPGNFYFDPNLHDYSSKTVLGVTIPAGGGKSDGDFVLDLLANHPSTARYVSRKMARFLLAYEPPTSVVDDLVQIYMSTGGDIKVMVRHVLQPATIASVPAPRRRKLKRPLHLVTSLMRAVEVDSQFVFFLLDDVDRLGHQPFFWPTPDGYPDDIESWGNSMLSRWTFVTRLMGRDIGGSQPDIDVINMLLATAPAGSSLPEAIDWVLTGGALGPQVRAEIQRYLNSRNVNGVVLREAFALAAASPGYQFY